MTAITDIDWRYVSDHVVPRRQAFIDGRFLDGADLVIENISPIDGRSLGQVASCGPNEIDLAVAAARRAFERRSWCGLAPRDRKNRLLRFADAVDAARSELAALETLDCGKAILNSYGADVPKSSNCIRWFAELIDKLQGEIPATRPDALALVSREPLGVIGLITPWNYPLYLGVVKAAPALAAGNSVVMKPSEHSPLTSLRLAEIAVEAGIPPGVFNVVPGLGDEAGKALCLHPDVDAIGFTGSTRVGGLVMQYAGQSNIKRVALECGGKSPQIVFADADLDRAADGIANGIFYNQGEVCNAGSRLLVQASVKDELLARLALRSEAFQPGDPLDPSVQMGAMIHEAHMHKVLRHIDVGQKEGATLVFGGERARQESGGFYITPAIFDSVDGTMQIAREEIFGPVLVATSFETFDQALLLANDTEYGLAAGVWTRDITRAHTAAQRLHAGSVWINSFNVSDITVPFGGMKKSGYGKDKSQHALDNYTALKMTWIELAS